MLPVAPERLKTDLARAATALRAGRMDEAVKRYRSFEKIAPELPEPPFQLGRIALRLRRPKEAVSFLEKADRLKPQTPVILSALADALSASGAAEESLDVYDQLLKLGPKEVKPRADKALALQRLGRFSDAETEFRKALKLAPKEGELYRTFLATKKLTKGDPLIGAMQRAWSDKSVQGRSRIHLGYALAKAMEEIGQPDKSFRYLKMANDRLRAKQPFDIAMRRSEVEGLIAAFRGGDFASANSTDEGPVFVTGLPRSGTTLVEQIIAAHPQMRSGGEMRHVLAAAYAVIGMPETGFRPIGDVTSDDLARFGALYRNAVAAQHGEGPRLTDKSIHAHLVMGLIAKALPGARIIVVRRDPRDLGLSIYRNYFAEGTHKYATDLADIAAYIATFERMVAFWQETMPGGFTEVSYEDLIAEPDAKSRALVDAAGLDWDPACLEFYKNSGTVQTLSVHQVRQPIYTGSVGAWRRHEAELRPLIEGLEAEGVLPNGA